MPIQTFQRIHDGNRVSVMIQDRLERSVNSSVLKNPLIGDSRHLTSVLLTVGRENLVEHGLGRLFLGWFVSDALSSGAIVPSIARWSISTADLARYLPLITTATTTVNIVVF